MVRARVGTKTRVWEDAFLTAFRVHGVASAAARTAGVQRTTVYERRNNNPEFAALWAEAEQDAIDAIELAVWNAVIAEGDMQTGRWILSRRRPEKWGDKMALEHSGPDGGPIEVEHQVDVAKVLSDPAARKALEDLAMALEDTG